MAIPFVGSIVGRVISIGVSILIAVVAYFVWNKGQEKVAEAQAPEVGTCIKPTGTATNADHEEVPCSSADASYIVVADDGKCDKFETSYTITLGDISDEGNVADLCLALNAAVGDCFEIDIVSNTATKAECAAVKGPNSFTITLVGDDVDAKCPKGSLADRNTTRNQLICRGPNV